MRQARNQAVVDPVVPQQIPMLDAGDLPGEEDWAVLESLGFDHGVGGESDPDADFLEEVRVARGAFD